jgi:hypothetical protein
MTAFFVLHKAKCIPFCGRWASSGHRSLAACGHSAVYPIRIHVSTQTVQFSEPLRTCAKFDGFPALYWLTLCTVCLLHFLLLQNVFLSFGTCTILCADSDCKHFPRLCTCRQSLSAATQMRINFHGYNQIT